LKGEVIFKGRLADVQTGNVPIHVRVEDAQNKLVVGQMVNVTIVVDHSNPVLAVPEAAIHDEGEGPALTVVREGKAIILHPEFGAEQDGWIAVNDGGLKEGELVVTVGAYNLPPKTPVKTEPADEVPDERK
jgi:multidrug efflux pump subunit AcrA (membrane-fusion protein)